MVSHTEEEAHTEGVLENGAGENIFTAEGVSEYASKDSYVTRARRGLYTSPNITVVSVSLRPNSAQGRLIVEVSRSHEITFTLGSASLSE